MRRLMTIFAHQDDETFSAGGILAKYAQIGESCAVTVTSDEARRNEFKDACEILGCRGIILENRNVDNSNELSIKKQIVDVIRDFKPDIVVTHIDFDYHHEHKKVRELVEEAVEWVSHTTSDNVAHQVSALWAAETTVLIPVPQIYIDISEHNDCRLKAIEVYESQSHKGGDGFYSRFHSTRTRLRGIQAEVEHAEAFVRVPITTAGSFKPTKHFSEFPDN